MIQYIIQGVMSCVGAVIGAMQFLGQFIAVAILSLVHNAYPTISYTQWLTLYGNINYFLPVSEAITLGVTYLTAYLAVAGYRLVKSWLPTVSS